MSEISKLITKYIEEFVSSCDKDNKDDIMKEFKSKENKKKLDAFITSNNIKKKKNKSDKDEDKPKKPLTGYFIYSKENRDIVMNSGITDNIEITKELSKRWNTIKTSGSDEFKKYNEMSEKQKGEYYVKMAEYKKTHGIVDKPKSAFQHFKEEKSESLKSQFPDISKNEIHRKLQIKWKELQSEKCETVKKYMNMAKNENEGDSDKTEVDVQNKNDKVDENAEEAPKTIIKQKKKDKDTMSSTKKKTPAPA